MVIAAVPLLAPNYQGHAEDKTVHPANAVLVDLAVCEPGANSIITKYRPIDFVPERDRDPVILVHQGQSIRENRVAAYEDLVARYSRYLEVCSRLRPMAKAWTAERLASFEETLSALQPLQV